VNTLAEGPLIALKLVLRPTWEHHQQKVVRERHLDDLGRRRYPMCAVCQRPLRFSYDRCVECMSRIIWVTRDEWDAHCREVRRSGHANFA
jgi:hypothetical protein